MRAILGAVLLILFSSPVFSYPTYEGCKDCHGGFEDGSYVSNEDGSNWGTDLMDAHETFVSGTCNSCHSSDPTPVGEHVAPFYYGKSGITIFDSCDADSSGCKFGANGLDPSQSYDVQVTPNDTTDDGTARTALNLFQTFAAGEIIFSDSFEYSYGV